VKRTLHVSIVIVGVLASLAARALDGRQASAPARTPIDVSKLGPQVGERVPDFSLKDQSGKAWTLDSIMGPKGAMLVFFRSADW
jgi:cytochrome oxidase Cu insertion factor (SCO1/SenC/PrrC family)